MLFIAIAGGAAGLLVRFCRAGRWDTIFLYESAVRSLPEPMPTAVASMS